MPTRHLVPADLAKNYEVHEWRNACGVLATAYPDEWTDIQTVLRGFRLRKSQIVAPGGNKSDLSKSFDSPLMQLGWVEKQFRTGILLDGVTLESPTHKIDCYKNGVALEIEWNNKDPFYDRDLNNFRLLFDLRAIGVGVIVTRCDALQKIFNALGKGSSYGNSTTHMSKLLPRIEGGGGGGCPIVVFGISERLYDENA